MHPRIIVTIVLKDLRDAIRDGRILMALLIPLGLGLVYNIAMPEAQKPQVTVAFSAVDATALPAELRAIAGSAVNLRFNNFQSAAAVRTQVETKKADIGIVVPAGFDAAIASGSAPKLMVVRPPGAAAFGADYVTSALDGALRSMAGQHAPAVIAIEATQPPTDSLSVITQLGVRKYMVLSSLIMVIAMIAIYLLPCSSPRSSRRRPPTPSSLSALNPTSWRRR